MRQMNRRDFLERSAAAAGAGLAAAGAAERHANPKGAQLHVVDGAVNTGVLVKEGAGLLFDCCDSVTPDRLARLGVDRVEMICCTQYRRPNTAGAGRFVQAGAKLVVPKSERDLIERPEAYWADWKNRWHLYGRPKPQAPAAGTAVSRGVGEGDVVEWRGLKIRVVDTPGATDGAVTYLVDFAGEVFAFCGDVIYGPGQVYELYSLQHGFGAVGDYHGFLGHRSKLLSSLHKLAACGADQLVPSHGAPVRDVKAATELAAKRLEALWRNYTSISALNHYFPSLFDDTKDDPARMTAAETAPPPEWVRRVAFTSFAVVSETGGALLIDCGHDSVIGKLQDWLRKKDVGGVEACWVTHYHDDHVDSLQRFANTFPAAPIMCHAGMAEIIEHPRRFYLPCISPCGAPVGKAARDGESWAWHEFKITAYRFPGQTLYHGGLMVEGRGAKVFFAGDSGAPTGLDDYCAGNRVFLGKGRGSRYCLDVWRRLKPTHIINEHQDRAFSFTPEQLDYMDGQLAERERLIRELCPWPDANFAIDPWWARTWPYDQETLAGSQIRFEVRFTNHGDKPARAEVEPVLPEGWRWRETAPVEAAPKADAAVSVLLDVPGDAQSGRYTIPVRITWNGKYLGPYRHAIIEIA